MLRKLKNSLATLVGQRNKWMIIVFAAYLLSIATFACIYYGIYLYKPGAFAFNRDILRSQSEMFRLKAEKDVTELQHGRTLLSYLVTTLSKNPISPETGSSIEGSWKKFKTPKYDFTFHLKIVGLGGQGPPAIFYRLQVTDRGGKEIILMDFNPGLIHELPKAAKDATEIARRLDNEWASSLNELKRRLATIGGPTPEVWGFFDFLYFSAITQSTVGYGDILPNSIAVRIVVVIQLILTTALIVVILNIVVSPRLKS